MKNYNKVTLLIFLSIILFILFPVSMNFTIYPLGIFYLINLLVFIFFWIIPVIKLYKKKSTLKQYSIMFIIFIIVSISVWLVWNEYWKHNNKIKMNQVRDTTRLNDYKKVENIIFWNKSEKYLKFSDIEDINGYHIYDPTTCYYYKQDENNYIFALKFESNKFIEKFWETFIFKSNKEEILSEKQYSEIESVVNNKCN